MVLLGDNSESAEEVAGARTFAAMRAPGVIMTPVGHDAAECSPRKALPSSRSTGASRAFRATRSSSTTRRRPRRRRAPARVGSPPNRAVARKDELVERRRATRRVPERPRRRRRPGGRETHRADRVPGRRRRGRISRLLADEAPAALFAGNNVLAELAWHAIRKRGLSIPRDVSLVAFDDVPWMGMVEPGITAVAQPTSPWAAARRCSCFAGWNLRRASVRSRCSTRRWCPRIHGRARRRSRQGVTRQLTQLCV